jgi:hypothetical protein
MLYATSHLPESIKFYSNLPQNISFDESWVKACDFTAWGCPQQILKPPLTVSTNVPSATLSGLGNCAQSKSKSLRVLNTAFWLPGVRQAKYPGSVIPVRQEETHLPLSYSVVNFNSSCFACSR